MKYTQRYYPSNLQGSKIRNAVTGHVYENCLVGSIAEKKFFKAIVIDHLNHPKCESDNQEPQILIDNFGNKIPVIWSNSISFQRFQRYIFGDINQDDYATYLKNYNKKFFCLFSVNNS